MRRGILGAPVWVVIVAAFLVRHIHPFLGRKLSTVNIFKQRVEEDLDEDDDTADHS